MVTVNERGEEVSIKTVNHEEGLPNNEGAPKVPSYTKETVDKGHSPEGIAGTNYIEL